MPVGPLPLALPEMTIRTSTDEGARAVGGNRHGTPLVFHRQCPPQPHLALPGRFCRTLVQGSPESKSACGVTLTTNTIMYTEYSPRFPFVLVFVKLHMFKKNRWFIL